MGNERESLRVCLLRLFLLTPFSPLRLGSHPYRRLPLAVVARSSPSPSAPYPAPVFALQLFASSIYPSVNATQRCFLSPLNAQLIVVIQSETVGRDDRKVRRQESKRSSRVRRRRVCRVGSRTWWVRTRGGGNAAGTEGRDGGKRRDGDAVGDGM